MTGSCTEATARSPTRRLKSRLRILTAPACRLPIGAISTISPLDQLQARIRRKHARIAHAQILLRAHRMTLRVFEDRAHQGSSPVVGIEPHLTAPGKPQSMGSGLAGEVRIADFLAMIARTAS